MLPPTIMFGYIGYKAFRQRPKTGLVSTMLSFLAHVPGGIFYLPFMELFRLRKI